MFSNRVVVCIQTGDHKRNDQGTAVPLFFSTIGGKIQAIPLRGWSVTRDTNSTTEGMSLTKPVETPAHQMPGSLEIINANSRTVHLQG
jgi:hypothetical protein